ncbi:putative gluconeogenesis factor [Podospora australis]|uniref:Gluconeogenesis factor n=1 Tax=Podospora australis TaxID=1536484 RepID=A0AAN6X071_9PEZI|nr:putative gluconeogenesis factor [Podospora australis]
MSSMNGIGNANSNGTANGHHYANGSNKNLNGHTEWLSNGDGNEKSSDSQQVGITVFSGGTAANSLVDLFNKIVEPRKRHLSYVIPISDNGGSSSELIRFVGGPSVGDIRSRLVRLIPNNQSDEMTALRTLFEYRLPADKEEARTKWLEIIESDSDLWHFISSPKRELIRSVLNTLNLEIVKRTRPSGKYNFSEASIGNMFLTGARIFSGSLESAIYLLSMICSIPRWVDVLPAINSNHTHHISASLEDGTVLTGQMAISHPSAPTAPDLDKEDDASLPDALAELRRQNIEFSKDEEEDLSARIERLWYINLYGHEITANANPKVIDALEKSDTVIYSIGSLYTSLIPSLVLPKVGNALAEYRHIRNKILILNSTLDRETGPPSNPLTAVDFVKAIVRACEERRTPKAKDYGSKKEEYVFREETVKKYVTHLVYLGENEEMLSPKVNRRELERLGIKCVKAGTGKVVDGKLEAKYRYDEEELKVALEGIIDA